MPFGLRDHVSFCFGRLGFSFSGVEGQLSAADSMLPPIVFHGVFGHDAERFVGAPIFRWGQGQVMPLFPFKG